MNERIQELKKQCYRVENPEGLFPREVFDEDMFVELIVQDCIAQIALIGISNFQNDDIMWAVDLAIEKIRERFELK